MSRRVWSVLIVYFYDRAARRHHCDGDPASHDGPHLFSTQATALRYLRKTIGDWMRERARDCQQFGDCVDDAGELRCDPLDLIGAAINAGVHVPRLISYDIRSVVLDREAAHDDDDDEDEAVARVEQSESASAPFDPALYTTAPIANR